MRCRTLSPDLFDDEKLIDLAEGAGHYQHLLLFEGLWCLADREGRLEDKPRYISRKIFRAAPVDVEPLLADLARAKLIRRYRVGDRRYIAVLNFLKYQHPHRREMASVIPAPVLKTRRIPQQISQVGSVLGQAQPGGVRSTEYGVRGTETEDRRSSEAPYMLQQRGCTAAAGTVPQRVRTAPRPKTAASPPAPTAAAAATAHTPSPKHLPVFRGHRLVLFEWALQDACLTLGREQYENFGIDAFLTQCDAKLEAMRVVLPVKDQARWFLAELAQEAQRRGSELVTAASLHEKTPYDTMNDRCREDQEFLPIGHIVIPVSAREPE